MGFDEAEIDYVNKRLKAQEMKIRLADKVVSELAAAEASAAARESCTSSDFLCRRGATRSFRCCRSEHEIGPLLIEKRGNVRATNWQSS